MASASLLLLCKVKFYLCENPTIARKRGAGSKIFYIQPKRQRKVLTIAEIEKMVFNSNTVYKSVGKENV